MSPPVDEPLPLHCRQTQLQNAKLSSQPPTGGTYYGLYLPEACAIITSVSYSPTYSLEKAGVAEKEIPSRIPPLHQLSNVLWAVWESLLYEPGNLRYYAVGE